LIRTIIFDIGNVLLFHDNDLLCRNLAGLCDLDAGVVMPFFFRSDFGQRAALGGLSATEMHAEFCREFGVGPDYPSFVRVCNSHFTPNLELEPLVRCLAGRYRLLTLSNTNPIHVEYMREHFPILEVFDDLVLSCEVGMGKPQPEIYREAVRRSGCRPEECVFTDDIPAYVEAARSLGMQGIVFSDTARFERELPAAGVEWGRVGGTASPPIDPKV
jgi:FMN phosphatase YigB (HAD superfamily)